MDRQSFTYKGKVLIEKGIFLPPFHHEVVFQEEGCLLYFKDVETDLFSSTDYLRIKNSEAVLLRCGSYLIDILESKKKDKVEVIGIHLYPEMLKEIFIEDLPELIAKRNHNKRSQVISPKKVISKYMDSLEVYFENPYLVNDDLLELKIKELILLLVQTKNIQSILDLITDLYSPKSINFKKVIDMHLYSNLQIEHLAKLCNLSLSSFNREFKKEFNDTPKNYILSKKVEKAKQLLRHKKLSISEVAYETGFNDPLYFTRVFKKRTGSSPSTYRNLSLN